MPAYRSLSLHRITVVALVLLVLTLASRDALTQALRSAPAYLISESQANAPRSHSDAGGQTASPNPSGGFDQEERVRQMLAQQYEQRFGESDEAIRSALGMRGKVADFVGYNSSSDQWLIAESKGGDIDYALRQLQNTLDGLRASAQVGGAAQIELRLYLNPTQFAKLLDGKLLGWRLQSGYLGYMTEDGAWIDQLVNGLKVLVQPAP